MTPVLLAPAALLLAGLLAGPVIAHLALRRPEKDIRYGAMLLLERVLKRQRRRRRLQDLPLLLLRLLLLALVVLAAARPELQWPGTERQPGDLGPVVVVIDDSLSMDHRAGVATGDETLLTLARAQAAEFVRALPEGASVGAVAISGEARRLTPELSTDRAGVAGIIEDVRQRQGGTDLAGGLRAARRLLGGGGGTVVVYSDEAGPTAVPGAREEISLLGKQDVSLEPRPVQPAAPSNLVITSAVYGDGLEGGSVQVEVVNHGQEAVEVPLVVSLPSGAEITVFVELPPEGTASETVTVPRVTEGGVGIARLDDPSLDADDEFAFHLPRVGASRVLVVDGDPGPTPTASEVYFLERALAPWGLSAASHGGVVPEVTSPAGVQALDPEHHRVVFLANVSDPGPLAPALTAFVQQGGGLVISMGDNVTADPYNAALASLLPAPLRDVRALSAVGEPGVRTALPDVSTRLFSPFARGGRVGFSKVRWRRVFTLEPFEDTDEVRTLMRLEGGLPLLVERRVGRGRVLFLTGTLDLGWGNFPLQSVYMPWTQRVVSYLGGETGGGGDRLTALVGETVSVSIPDSSLEVSVQGPQGPVASRVRSDVVQFTPPVSGAYKVETPGAPPLAWVAVNTDPIESDVRPGPSLVRIAAEVDPERYLRREPLAAWLLAAALMVALVQAVWALIVGRREHAREVAEPVGGDHVA